MTDFRPLVCPYCKETGNLRVETRTKGGLYHSVEIPVVIQCMTEGCVPGEWNLDGSPETGGYAGGHVDRWLARQVVSDEPAWGENRAVA